MVVLVVLSRVWRFEMRLHTFYLKLQHLVVVVVVVVGGSKGLSWRGSRVTIC